MKLLAEGLCSHPTKMICATSFSLLLATSMSSRLLSGEQVAAENLRWSSKK
jgi:hypothetical protein